MTQSSPQSREDLFEEIGGAPIEEASSMAHDRVEEHFMRCAEELLLTSEEIGKLEAAGFVNLVANVKHLKNASSAYDLSRENQ